MPDQWVTIAEAAAYLKVHPRTIERRIASARLESRRADDGQVQIKLDLPEPEPTAQTASSEALGAVKELADRQVDIAAGSASAIVRLAQDAAERTTHDLLLAREELGAARQSSRRAWVGTGILAGLLPALVMAAISWGIRGIAKAEADVRVMSDQLTEVRGDLQQTQTLAQTLRTQMTDAQLAHAKAQGELDAYRNELSARQTELAARQAELDGARESTRLARESGPTTRPATLLARLVEALAVPPQQ